MKRRLVCMTSLIAIDDRRRWLREPIHRCEQDGA